MSPFSSEVLSKIFSAVVFIVGIIALLLVARYLYVAIQKYRMERKLKMDDKRNDLDLLKKIAPEVDFSALESILGGYNDDQDVEDHQEGNN